MLILFIIFYYYGIIGIHFLNELNSTQTQPKYNFANFNSFPKALLALFQILTEVNWNAAIFEYNKKFKSPFLISIFFSSFHMISVLILMNLIKGKLFNT